MLEDAVVMRFQGGPDNYIAGVTLTGRGDVDARVAAILGTNQSFDLSQNAEVKAAVGGLHKAGITFGGRD